ncbi:MAG: putative toxin-antitoxin system toxin component, PIN family [Polaromonas sp.]
MLQSVTALPDRGQTVVIDTNIVLDLLVFADEVTAPLRQALEGGELRWLATPAMRDELERVLAYPKIVSRLAFYQLTAGEVLSTFDATVHLCDVPGKSAMACRDADDQKFIDLAIAHQALLLSKDRHILSMKKRILACGGRAQSTM